MQRTKPPKSGSIIAVVATDAPLLPHQLGRLAGRVPLGVARTGGVGENSSGDLFTAFSTANAGVYGASEPFSVTALPNETLSGPFRATV